MPTKPKYTILPARMSINPDSLNNWQVMVLDFPIKNQLESFADTMAQILTRPLRPYEKPPYRKLNNLLLSLTSTITHGFEKINKTKSQALAIRQVDKPNEPLPPAPEKIAEVINVWLQSWVNTYFPNIILEKGAAAWKKLLSELDLAIVGWEWQIIKPQTLLLDTNSQDGVSYRAIGSILAAILHNTDSVIKGEDKEKTIKWQKAVGGKKNNLFVLSKPFSTQKGKRVDYGAYKIEFFLQTQAGHYYPGTKKLKPWIFIELGTQRYARNNVTTNFKRNTSFMVRLNKERLDGFAVDSTLVKLQADYDRTTGQLEWVSPGLAELIKDYQQSKLAQPKDILANPKNFANFDDDAGYYKNEYYVVYAEGFRQNGEAEEGVDEAEEVETKKVKHLIKTGNSFADRRQVIAAILQRFEGILEPDNRLDCDVSGAVTDGRKKGVPALLDFSDITESARRNIQKRDILKAEKNGKPIDEVATLNRYAKNREKGQPILAEALNRATQNKPVQLYLFYHTQAMRTQIELGLEDAFLLNCGNPFPDFFGYTAIPVTNNKLIEELERTRFSKTAKTKYSDPATEAALATAQGRRADEWKNFLDKEIPALREDCYNLALVELPSKGADYDISQGIKGAVRDACARKGLNSQMLLSSKPSEKEGEVENRVRSAVRDILYRHTGALLGKPSGLFETSGIPSEIADKMDVIALCRVESSNINIHYALAVRLRATGQVDVLFPKAENWVSYTAAGSILGKIFSQERGKLKNGNQKYSGLLKMNGAELAGFAASVLGQRLENPTLVLVDAARWRNGVQESSKTWPQLQNGKLAAEQDILDFTHVAGMQCFKRDNKAFKNLLGIIRIRQGDETPQYIPGINNWTDNKVVSDLLNLTGFIDPTVPELLHYFSVGKRPATQKNEAATSFKYESEGATTSYKHQQMLELVPFFVRSDFQEQEKKTVLCRVAHFLRINPAWGMGNTVKPYPMHLGETLIEDQFCIIRLDKTS